ncbi:MAG: TorF family putative porin [Cellvibrionaceae bacterium]
MKTLSKTLLASAIIAAGSTGANIAHADLSANAGFVSDYYFRGSNLGDAGLYAGLDYENGGFYAGTWWIDDGTGGNDGLEQDFYFGYGLDVSGVSLGLGYTRYEYTNSGDFEHEINFTAGFGAFGFEYSTGEDDDDGAEETDYDFIALSWSGDVFGATVGTFENDDTDDSYDYIELSASGEVAGLDATISIGQTSNAESGGVSGESGDGYMVLDISKSFDL